MKKVYYAEHRKDVFGSCSELNKGCEFENKEFRKLDEKFDKAAAKTHYEKDGVSTRVYADFEGVDCDHCNDKVESRGDYATKDYVEVNDFGSMLDVSICQSGGSYYFGPLLRYTEADSAEVALTDVNDDGIIDVLVRITELSGKIYIGVYEGAIADDVGFQ